MGIFPSFPVLLRTVFLHPKPHLQKSATSLHFGGVWARWVGGNSAEPGLCSPLKPRAFDSSRERVPRAFLRRWSQRLQGPLTDLLVRAGRTSLQPASSTNFQKPHKSPPEGSPAGGWGRQQQTGGCLGGGERLPFPAPPQLPAAWVFAVSPAGARAARSRALGSNASRL